METVEVTELATNPGQRQAPELVNVAEPVRTPRDTEMTASLGGQLLQCSLRDSQKKDTDAIVRAAEWQETTTR